MRYVVLVTAIVIGLGLSCRKADAPSPSNVSFNVWILDNNDADFETPPFEDTLTIWSDSGKKVVKKSTFNICQTIGGHRAIAVSPDDSFALIAENVTHRLSKYKHTGEESWVLEGSFHCVDISSTGRAYSLTSEGTIYGKELLEIDTANGKVMKRVQVDGFDLVVDDSHKAIWVVGADIRKLNHELEIEVTLDPVAWYAVSVDYASDGSVWVAESDHPEVGDSRRRMLKVSPAGDVLEIVPLDEDPACLAVDRSDDSVWVATRKNVYQFSSAGAPRREIECGSAFVIRIRQPDRSVWIATRKGNVIQLSKEGEVMGTISGFSEDQKYVAVP